MPLYGSSFCKITGRALFLFKLSASSGFGWVWWTQKVCCRGSQSFWSLTGRHRTQRRIRIPAASQWCLTRILTTGLHCYSSSGGGHSETTPKQLDFPRICDLQDSQGFDYCSQGSWKPRDSTQGWGREITLFPHACAQSLYIFELFKLPPAVSFLPRPP